MAIIRTKLTPVDQVEILDRPALMARLVDIEHTRLTVVSAAAGYGKSTLLSQWYRSLRSRRRVCGWLSADGAEGEGTNWLSYVIAAAAEAGVSLEPEIERFLRIGACASAELLTTALLQSLERFRGRVFLFFDDVHLLSTGPIATLDHLIERTPPNVSFIVSSRGTPTLHLARRRARGELLEIRAEDLKFSEVDIERLLGRAVTAAAGADTPVAVAEPVQSSPKNSQAAVLERDAEGWIAGVKLSIPLLGRAPLEGAVSITGSNRAIAEFFEQEVFDGQRPEVGEFLLRTSVLERFCSSLCDAVTGRSDARRLLDEIELRGLFLIACDQERNWYRYHPLFAAFLRRRLHEQEPEAEQLLLLRASEWFSDTGCPTDAIEYARLAGTTLRAADLLEQRCQDPNYVGKVRLVCKFAGEIPQSVLRRYPGILLTLAWRLSRNMRFKEAAELIAAANARLQELEESCEMPARDLRRLRYVLQHRQMVLAGAQDNVVKTEDLCHSLLREYTGEQHPYLHGNIYSHLLAAQREQYKIADLERTAAIACGVVKRSSYCSAAVGLQASIGPSLFMAGLTGRARAILEQGRLESIGYSGRSSSATSACSLGLSELAYESNEIDLAEQLVNEGLPSARECGFVDQLQAGFLTLARIRAVRGDVGAALSTLDDGMALANERDLERLRLSLTAERIRLLVQSGALDKARIEAQEQHVSLDDPAPLPGTAPTTRDEQRAFMWVRLAQASDQFFSAIAMARRWRSFCASRGAIRSLIRWNILLAQLHFLSAGHRAAQRSLREALDHGASGRMLRSFLDEGPLMQTLLGAASNVGIESPRPADVFARELLSHFDGRPPKPEYAQKLSTVAECFCGHLSPKEREILSLVGAGMSNREVAEHVGVTEGTVKWYLQQVYDKVGTRRRQQAVQRARQFGLIAS